MPVQYRKSTLTPLAVLSEATSIPFAINTTKAIFKLWSIKKSKPGKKSFPLCIECRQSLFILAPPKDTKESHHDDKEASINSVVTATADAVGQDDISEHPHKHDNSEQCACCANLTNFVIELNESDDDEQHSPKQLNAINEDDSHNDSVSESSSATASSPKLEQTCLPFQTEVQTASITIAESPVVVDIAPTVELVEPAAQLPVEFSLVVAPVDELAAVEPQGESTPELIIETVVSEPSAESVVIPEPILEKVAIAEATVVEVLITSPTAMITAQVEEQVIAEPAVEVYIVEPTAVEAITSPVGIAQPTSLETVEPTTESVESVEPSIEQIITAAPSIEAFISAEPPAEAVVSAEQKMTRTPPPSILSNSPLLKEKNTMPAVELPAVAAPIQTFAPRSASPIQQEQPPRLQSQSPTPAPVQGGGLKRKDSFLKRKTSSATLKATAWWNRVQSKFTHKEL
ncbi:UNVERIFIED_CONTAM: hypothetical protein HDU68_003842 [Siphonaria sp. JEL0065]|nr:hypothetical protein HDU68_003842 [Siphonaria sp. JEL0065]